MKNENEVVSLIPDNKEKQLHTDLDLEKSNFTRKFNMDEYLDKVGYNRYHYNMIFIISLVFFIEGCEMIVLNIMLPTIVKEFELGNIQRSLLSSSIFFGYFTGSLISGSLINKHGRLKVIKATLMIISVLSVLTGLSLRYFLCLFGLRFLSGIGIGILIPACVILIAESIPTRFRSFVMNIAWIFYPIGIIYICLLSIYFTRNMTFSWRKICLINSLNYIPVITLTFLLNESPRFLLLKGLKEELVKILNKIGFSSGINLSQEEMEEIGHICNTKSNQDKLSHLSICFLSSDDLKLIFDKKNFSNSLILYFLWFSSSFITYGLIYILPKIFEVFSFSNSEDRIQNLKQIIIAMFIIIPCPIIRGSLSELRFLGRRYTIFLGFFLTFITSIICLCSDNYLYIYSGILKFLANFAFGIILVYTSEVFETKIRPVALGIGSSFNRLGGFATPFICEICDNLVFRGSFYAFAFFAILSSILTLLLPIETLGKPLDALETKED